MVPVGPLCYKYVLDPNLSFAEGSAVVTVGSASCQVSPQLMCHAPTVCQAASQILFQAFYAKPKGTKKCISPTTCPTT